MKKYSQTSKKSETAQAKAAKQAPVDTILSDYKGSLQRKTAEDDELLQGKFEPSQLKGKEDDELLQGKFETTQLKNAEEDELLQGKFETSQLKGKDEEELLQGKFETSQLKKGEEEESVQKKANDTGLPDNLKSGVENLSGYAMDDVKVHYNSSKPNELNAHAYAQGTDIHMAPGQEKHLPHEAWHVVQQKQGRVKPTMQMKGKVNVNDDKGLENEADVMGAKALNTTEKTAGQPTQLKVLENDTMQMVKWYDLENLGRRWLAQVWLDPQNGSGGNKQDIINQVLQLTGFQLGTVFQQYDPYIRGGGAYKTLIKTLDANDAQSLLDFHNGDIDLTDLSVTLQKMAIIIYIAEVGRGYSSSVFNDLPVFLNGIIQNTTQWSQVNTGFSPSLTYKQDNSKDGEYKPH
jgi:hypothetical protein